MSGVDVAERLKRDVPGRSDGRGVQGGRGRRMTPESELSHDCRQLIVLSNTRPRSLLNDGSKTMVDHFVRR